MKIYTLRFYCSYEELGSTSHIFNQQPIQQVDSFTITLYRHYRDSDHVQKHGMITITLMLFLSISRNSICKDKHDTLHMRINSEDNNTFVPDATFLVEDHIMNDKDLVSNSEIETTKRFTYRLNFNPYMNNTENLEVMHEGHALKFINGTIHIVSSYAIPPVDENDEGTLDTLTSLKDTVLDFNINKAIEASKFNDTFLIDIAPTVSQEEDLKITADTPLDLGTIIDTGIPCTQEELWKRES